MADKWEYLMVNVTRGGVAKDVTGWLIEELFANGAGTQRYKNAPETLNMLGEQGWELVVGGSEAAFGHTAEGYLIFKRRKA